MRAALLLLAIALIAAALLLFFSEGTDPAVSAVEPAAAQTAEELGGTGLPGLASPFVETSSSRQDASGATDVETEPVTEPGPAAMTLRGTALRVDALGVEVRGEDGGFILWVENDGGFEPLAVEVKAGEWMATFAPCETVLAEELTLGGLAVGLRDHDYPVPEDLFLELRGQTLQSVRLHVVADEDGTPLSGLEVLRGDVRWADAYPYGEELEPTGARGVSSPVALQPPPISSATNGKQGYWVRAPGRAWGGIEIDHGDAGERELRLFPGGELALEILGAPLPDGLALRLYPDANSNAGAIDLGREPAAHNRFENLAAGDYRVQLELGWSRRALCFGEVLVQVVAARRTEAQLQLREIEPPARDVSVAGELRVPPGWPDVEGGLALKFEPVGDTRSWGAKVVEIARAALEPTGPGRFLFHKTLSHAGSYVVTIAPVSVRQPIEVGADGERNIVIELPVLTRLNISVEAADGGQPVEAGSLNWMPAGSPGYSHSSAKPSPPAQPGEFEFVVPAGEVELRVWPEGGYASRSVSAFLQAGQDQLTIEVERLCGFAFSFMDGEANVPFDTETRFRASTTTGEGVDLGWSSEGEVWFPAPGTYLFSMTDFAGFEPIEDFELTLERRAIVPFVLRLDRKE